MQETVKFALVGCGRIAANHLTGIKNAPHAKLAAVCDIIEEKAKKTAAENDLDHFYTDMEEMIEREKPDVCCILTPSGMHAQCAVRAAKRGVNILCEKPLDVNRQNMLRIINACDENHVKLGCIFQRRTFDVAIKVRNAVQEGRFGTITIGSANLRYYRSQEYYDSAGWRGTAELDGGGALMNQGIHGVDMLDWIMGGIYSVTAKCERLCWDIDVEDTATVLVKFKNGAVGTIECCTTAYPGLDTVFHISGNEGNVIFGDGGPYQWQFADKDFLMPSTTENMGGKNCAYHTGNYGHNYQIEDMALAVLSGREPMVTGSDAMRSVSIILAIYESARAGREVVIDEMLSVGKE